MSESTFNSLWVLWLVACTVLPAVLVLVSRRVAGGERLLWTIAVLFTSWLGFVAFLVVTTLSPSAVGHAAAKRRARRHVPAGLDISDHRPG